MENISTQQAVIDLTQETKEARVNGGLKKSIEIAQQKLALQNHIAAKEQANVTIMNMKAMNFSDSEIMDMVRYVSTLKKSGLIELGTPSMEQGNGHSYLKKLYTDLIGTGN